ncbi:MAG: ATP-dependent zinc metalloprotease FtsH [Chlorobi bacterium]|nr:ATP-dependent zinc metalloprotease FtsH [Chlorobiota bacterium]
MENKNEKKPLENKPVKPTNKKNKPKINFYWIYAILAIALFALQFINIGGNPKEITWQRFERNMLKQHDVDKIVVITNLNRVEIYIKKDRLESAKYSELFNKSFNNVSKSGPHYFFTIGSLEVFETNLEKAQKDFPPDEIIGASYKTRENVVGNIISWILPFVILIAIWVFIMRKMGGANGPGGQIFNIGKSKAKVFNKEDVDVKIDFKDVAGLEEAKIEIKEIVDFLKKPKKYTELGGKIPKGALLIGPPGTGKTLLAKAVAGEAHVPFFSMSGSDFVEMFVGVGASRVRDLFKQAKEKAPCIIFIDEIDAIGRARGRNPNYGANDERENTLNQLLTEMDGFASNSGVIILAATNRADILDRALMRAGRFDRQIHVELPDIEERRAIFEVHLKPLKKLDNKLDVDFLAKQTPGFSGADIANVCNEAALIAARKNKKQVEKQDFLDAVDRIVGGLEKKNKVISPREKKTIAYHEAGHATISWMLEHANPLIKVTIIPRGLSLGAAWYLPEERKITTTEQILDELCSALGGRASEELNFGKISTGALNDLEKVTKQAYAMVSYFGMSKKIGNVSFYDSTGQSEYSFNKPYSEKTAELIDNEVNEIIEKTYARALATLKKNRKGLTELAELLLEREVIFSEDLEKIFGKRKFENETLNALKNGNSTKKEEKKEEKIVSTKQAKSPDKKDIV